MHTYTEKDKEKEKERVKEDKIEKTKYKRRDSVVRASNLWLDKQLGVLSRAEWRSALAFKKLFWKVNR